MRIIGATIYALRIPFAEAFSHSAKARTFSDSIVVRLRTEDGTVGYGEGVARAYVTGETVETSLAHIRERLWPAVAESDYSELGLSPDPIATLSPVSETLPDGEASSEVVAWHGARAAVEIALIDSLLRRQKLSLADVLPPKRASITYSGVIDASGPVEKAVRRARHLKLFGIGQIKIKLTGTDDRERLAAIRQTVGPSASLRVDANGVYDVPQAIAALADLSEFKVEAFEQPIPRSEVAELAQVKARSTIPIMVDESLVTAGDARALIDGAACDLFNLRLSKCGGIVRTLEIARLARCAGLRMQLGSHVGETAILSAAGRHVAAYLDDLLFVEGSYGSLLLTEDVSRDSISFGHGGKAPALGRRHGLGVEVCEGVLRKYAHAIHLLGEG